MTSWTTKTSALLRCPPEGALLTGDQARARAAELVARLGIPGGLTEDADRAHRGAYGMEGSLAAHGTRERGLAAIHPFSAQKLQLAASAEEVQRMRAEALAAVDDAIEAIRRSVEGSEGAERNKRLCFSLWRRLPDFCSTSIHAPTLGPRWAALPASAGLPSQTVWQHAHVASALAGAGERPAVLVFNIASAQEFLATSRRTQDLWMGSFILSYLTWAGMWTLADGLGPDCIIIPDLRRQPIVDHWLASEGLCPGLDKPCLDDLRRANLPNVFTAIVPAESAADLAHKAEKAVYEAWRKLSSGVRTYIEGTAGDQGVMQGVGANDAWHVIWERQTRLFLKPDVFWAAATWPAIPDIRSVFAQSRELLGKRAADDLERAWQALRGGQPADGEEVGALYGVHAAYAGRTLQARKNLRTFSQTFEDGEKCTLCGQRSALRRGHVRSSKSEYDELSAFWTALGRVKGAGADEGGKLVGRIRRGDRLCSVCLTKRLAWEAFFIKQFGQEERRKESHVFFPSTSSMSTAAFRRDVLRRLAEEPAEPKTRELYEALRRFVRATHVLERLGVLFSSAPLKQLQTWCDTAESVEGTPWDAGVLEPFLRLDGDWLFEQAFDPAAVAREYSLDDARVQEAAAELRQAASALRRLLDAAAAVGVPRPDTYFALVAMDGDRMGQWLTGELAPSLAQIADRDAARSVLGQGEAAALRRASSAASQAALAEAAKTFALSVVPNVVEDNHCGCVVYAGGDDVLALVPLDELFDVLVELRDGYSGAQSGWFGGAGRYELSMGSEATISAGVIVAHRSHPFSQVVELAHGGALECDAKEDLGRSAFAIRVLKRSGEELRAGAPWRVGTPSMDVLSILGGVVCAFSGGRSGLSDRFVKDLTAERALAVLPVGAQEAELRRLIGRGRSNGGSPVADSAGVVAEQLAALLRGMVGVDVSVAGAKAESKASLDQAAFDRFTALLDLARFLAAGRRSA